MRYEFHRIKSCPSHALWMVLEVLIHSLTSNPAYSLLLAWLLQGLKFPLENHFFKSCLFSWFVWRFLKKLEIELSYDPAIPLLGIHTEETRIERVYFHCHINTMIEAAFKRDYFMNFHEIIKFPWVIAVCTTILISLVRGAKKSMWNWKYDWKVWLA